MGNKLKDHFGKIFQVRVDKIVGETVGCVVGAIVGKAVDAHGDLDCKVEGYHVDPNV